MEPIILGYTGGCECGITGPTGVNDFGNGNTISHTGCTGIRYFDTETTATAASFINTTRYWDYTTTIPPRIFSNDRYYYQLYEYDLKKNYIDPYWYDYILPDDLFKIPVLNKM